MFLINLQGKESIYEQIRSQIEYSASNEPLIPLLRATLSGN